VGKTENVTEEENNEESTTSNEHSESASVEMDNAQSQQKYRAERKCFRNE
jgi:hypothetical protein